MQNNFEAPVFFSKWFVSAAEQCGTGSNQSKNQSDIVKEVHPENLKVIFCFQAVALRKLRGLICNTKTKSICCPEEPRFADHGNKQPG